MLDLNVRQRFSSVRRTLLTLGWAPEGRGAAPRRDLILQDNLSSLKQLEGASAIDWRPDDPGLFDAHPERSCASPETRAAIFALAGTIRTESEILKGFAGAARDQAVRLARARADVAARLLGGDALREERLGEAVEAGINTVVREVAATALNVALAAVRAGAGVRGFRDVAQDVEDLARALRSAWETIDPSVEALEDEAAEAASLAADLRRIAADVKQRSAALGAPRRVSPELVREALDPIDRAAEAAGLAATAVAEACCRMAERVDAVVETLFVVVRETKLGDRRGSTRIAFETGCRLMTVGAAYAGRTVDLSETGALIRLNDVPDLRRGQPVTLALRDIGAISGTVVGVSGHGAHVSFDLGHGVNAAARPALIAALAATTERNEVLIARAGAFAASIGEAFDEGVARGEIDLAELMAERGAREQADGAAHMGAAAIAFVENTLSAVLSARLAEGDGIVYALVMDRSGDLMTQAAPATGLGMPGARAVAHSPATAASRRAARNLRPFLVQLCERDLGDRGAPRMVKAVSVPVFVGGRHWGAAELGFGIEDFDSALDQIAATL